MSKIKASFTHFIISALFILLFCSFVYFVWYQQVYFNVSGVIAPLKLLFVVDVVLGPLLTLVIYKQGKKHLKLDLTLIAAFQLIAFGYGAYHVFLGKPSLIVHRTGYLEVLMEKDIDRSQLSDEMKEQNFLFYPVYGKVDSEELTPVSSANEYLAQVTPFDVHNRESFNRPMTLVQTKDTFKNAQDTTQEQFNLIYQRSDEYLFYELKFGKYFGVLFIEKDSLHFESVLMP